LDGKNFPQVGFISICGKMMKKAPSRKPRLRQELAGGYREIN
jgi:hypothetical protein